MGQPKYDAVGQLAWPQRSCSTCYGDDLNDAPLLRVGAVPLDGVYASIRWHCGVWGVLFVLWLVPTALWLRGQPSTRG